MKRLEDNQLDKLFSTAFEEFQVEPSHTVWMGIERELDKTIVFKRRMWVMRFTVAASVLICLFVGSYYFIMAPSQIITADKKAPIMQEKNSINKKNKMTVQPISKDERLADVVEIKSNKSVPKLMKKNNSVGKTSNINKKQKMNEEEIKAVEILRKNEGASNISETVKPIEKTNVIEYTHPVSEKTLANASNSAKKTNNVVDVVNYVAGKVRKKEDSKLIAVNNQRNENGSTRKSYQIDLGVVKLTRIKNAN